MNRSLWIPSLHHQNIPLLTDSIPIFLGLTVEQFSRDSVAILGSSCLVSVKTKKRNLVSDEISKTVETKRKIYVRCVNSHRRVNVRASDILHMFLGLTVEQFSRDSVASTYPAGQPEMAIVPLHLCVRVHCYDTIPLRHCAATRTAIAPLRHCAIALC